MQGYMSITEATHKWGIGKKRINVLCREGRIPGAIMIGPVWAIPSDAEKPVDLRIKSGKYIKSESK